jgi:hypothetical protein
LQRKIIERDPVTGRTRERYSDPEPSRAVIGHGRPLRTVMGMKIGPVRIMASDRQ